MISRNETMPRPSHPSRKKIVCGVSVNRYIEKINISKIIENR